MYRVELLGGLKVIHNGQNLLRSHARKAPQLISYLAYHPQRSHAREILADLLWPECEPDVGRRNLSNALYELRKQFALAEGRAEDSFFCADSHAISINAACVETDVGEFREALQIAVSAADDAQRRNELIAATQLYQGELLAGYYEEWMLPQQQVLRELYLKALTQLVKLLCDAREFAPALECALKAAETDPLSERACNDVMVLYAQCGRSMQACSHFDAFVRRAAAENGGVSAKLRALHEQIRENLQAADAVVGNAATPSPASSHKKAAMPTMPSAETEVASLSASELEPIGGMVAVQSRFYVERQPQDGEFHQALARRDFIVGVKGPRQVGKSSLLAQGLYRAREGGAQVVFTQFQEFTETQLATLDSFLFALAENIAEQLNLDTGPESVWDHNRSPNMAFRRYLLRHVLEGCSTRLVWALDEVDRLFAHDYKGDVFSMFRAWHEQQRMNAGGAWANLSLVFSYSSEPYLFIQSIHQSPFNVGTHFTLRDFSREQVSELNRRYGSPLRSAADVDRFFTLLAGHPYLSRCGLHEMVSHATTLDTLEAKAEDDDWIFGDHLRRLAFMLSRHPDLEDIVRQVLANKPVAAGEAIYRLRSAGILLGEVGQGAQLRCPLYARYLHRCLNAV